MTGEFQFENKEERGLRYWMERVLAEGDKARDGFKAGAVHDLRTAMRRCRSIAEGFVAIDPEPAWKKMRKTSKPLFSALGELRDIHVQTEWVEKIGDKADPVTQKLLEYFHKREDALRGVAADAFGSFDVDQWSQWATFLDDRAQRLPAGGAVFQVMALERWRDAKVLQSTALRNRSKVALHQLRIGIKKFRYTLENFLPELHQRWIKDLKRIQDLLGDVHDLDVLWETARAIRVFGNPEQRREWFADIQMERTKRVEAYREKMLGKYSLWQKWRLALPDGDELHAAVLKHFETWAFFRDSDLTHTHRVLEMSMVLFEAADADAHRYEQVTYRDLLTVAALIHEADGGGKKGLKSFPKLTAPPGWKPAHLNMVSLIARYHRGSMPSESHKRYAALDGSARSTLNLLGGILRLAEAVDKKHDGQVQEIKVTRTGCALQVHAPGYQAMSQDAEVVAKARHLLEMTLGIPVVVTG